MKPAPDGFEIYHVKECIDVVLASPARYQGCYFFGNKRGCELNGGTTFTGSAIRPKLARLTSKKGAKTLFKEYSSILRTEISSGAFDGVYTARVYLSTRYLCPLPPKLTIAPERNKARHKIKINAQQKLHQGGASCLFLACG